jgi:hypothetical protein
MFPRREVIVELDILLSVLVDLVIFDLPHAARKKMTPLFA